MPPVFAEIGYFIIDYIGIDVAVADAIATVLEYVAIAELINIATQALSPSAKSGVGQGLETNYYNPEASFRIIYGTVRCGGMQTIPPITYGSNGEYLASVITYAGHLCDGFDDVWFDNVQILASDIGSISGGLNDGLVSGSSVSGYGNLAWIRFYDGSQTTPDYIINNEVMNPAGSWNNFTGHGICYIAYQFKFDPSAYTQVPNTTATVRGKKLYDPRLDSTQAGGSGSQRVNTPSTWVLSSNPALALADYLLANYGGEYDPTEINWTSFMTAANVCDFVLTGSHSTPDGDQARYTCNGAMLSTQGGGGQPFSDNIKLLVDAMLGRLIYANGLWSCYAGSWQTPNANVINKSDWASGLSFTFEQGRDKRINESHCWFISPDQNWQRVECVPRTNATYESEDGEVLPFETDQPFCTVEKEAQRKAEFIMRQSRNQLQVSGKLPPRFSGIQLWDTVEVNYADFGWSLKTFRVAGCYVNADGSVDVTLSEEDDFDWNDLLSTDYNHPSTSPTPTSARTTPSAPLGFGVQVTNGTLSFQWDQSAILPRGTRYRVLYYPASLSAQNSKQVLWQGDATHCVVQATVNSPFWAQVQAFVNSDFSALTPNTFGIQVVPQYTPQGSGWTAYFTGFTTKFGTTTPLTAGPVMAVVNSPTSPVYSWTIATSNHVTMNFGVGSASQTFTSSMDVGVSAQALATCHIVDGSNSISVSATIVIGRGDGSGPGGGGNA